MKPIKVNSLMVSEFYYLKNKNSWIRFVKYYTVRLYKALNTWGFMKLSLKFSNPICLLLSKLYCFCTLKIWKYKKNNKLCPNYIILIIINNIILFIFYLYINQAFENKYSLSDYNRFFLLKLFFFFIIKNK